MKGIGSAVRNGVGEWLVGERERVVWPLLPANVEADTARERVESCGSL